MKKRMLLTCLLCAAVVPLSAATYFANQSGEWNDAATWAAGEVPEFADGDAFTVTNSAVVTLSSAVNAALARSFVGANGTVGNVGSLFMGNGARLTMAERFYVGDRATGTLTMATGSLLTLTTNSSNCLYIGAPNASVDASGAVYIAGGEIRLNGTTPNINIANSLQGSAVGKLIMTAGTFSATATNSGFASLSAAIGCTLRAEIGLYGGHFSISGNTRISNPTNTNNYAIVTVSSKMDNVYFGGDSRLQGNATLHLLVEKDSDYTKAVVQGDTFRLNLNSELVIDFSKFGVWEGAEVGDMLTITLLAADTRLYRDATNNVVSVVGTDTTHFSFSNLFWTSNDLTIDVTYISLIPEPATSAALLGLLGLAFIARRRK